MPSTTNPRRLTYDDIESIDRAIQEAAHRPGPDANIGERQRASLHALNLHSWIVETYGRALVAEMRRLLAARDASNNLQGALENYRCHYCGSTQIERGLLLAIEHMMMAADGE